MLGRGFLILLRCIKFFSVISHLWLCCPLGWITGLPHKAAYHVFLSSWLNIIVNNLI